MTSNYDSRGNVLSYIGEDRANMRKKTAAQIKQEAWRLVCEIAALTNEDCKLSGPLLQSLREQAHEIINQPMWGTRRRTPR